ncbi:MAG: hypothetical protein U1E36_02865 [Rickettsiales bacterium]
MSGEPKLEKVNPFEVYKKLIVKEFPLKDADGKVIEGAVSPGVQKYLDSLPVEMKQEVNANRALIEQGAEAYLRTERDKIEYADKNLGPRELEEVGKHFLKHHHVSNSTEVETAMRKALRGTEAEKYLNDPRYGAEIKAQFANVLPKDQTVTVERINQAAKNIEASIHSASTPEEVVGAFKNELHAVHAEKIAAIKVAETAAATPSAPPGTTPEPVKTRINKLIDESLDAKAKPHAEQLKKSFDKVFGDIKDIEFDDEQVKAAVKKFSDEAIKTGDEAQKALKDGTLHDNFLKEVKSAVTAGTLDEEKIGKAITAQKEEVSKVLSRNLAQRLIGFKDHYSTKAISEDWAKIKIGDKEQRATSRLAMRAIGGATGVGLIISGIGDFQGREANDNSGQVEAHPVAGLIKTVGGSGLVALSALYRGMGRGGVAA